MALINDVKTTPVRLANICLQFGESLILKDVSLEVNAGEFVAIVGASGSGKTTLLHCMSGLMQPTSGSVHLAGHSIASSSPSEVAKVRLSNVGFVFQSADLVPELTLSDNIELPLRLNRVGARERQQRVDDLVEALGLAESRRRRPHEVSGGQAQRAAIGRALSAKPRIIFADEPTGALDSHNRGVVLSLLKDSASRDGVALVLVTHDDAVASAADRIITIVDGQLQ